MTKTDLPPHAALCRDFALRLTERASETGTADEASFGPWLADLLRDSPAFGPSPEVWAFPVAPGDPRHCIAMLVRGSGSQTVLLTGHYDTVTTSDYGDLRPLATQPEVLAQALAAQVVAAPDGTTEARVRDDIAAGFLPGRGLLDMKAGLAAGLTAISAFAASPQAGNLLFLAVPDEENASAGARAAARELPAHLAWRGVHLCAAINLDAIADDGDGTDGRVVATGTVGKVLPTAFVVGVPVHSGFPLRGINAAVLAGAIAARLEWAPELTDNSSNTPGTPISLLSLKDGKTGYDVTTPATAFATFSVLNHRRNPGAVLALIRPLVEEAANDVLSALRFRAAQTGGLPLAEKGCLVLTYGELHARIQSQQPDLDAALDVEAQRLRSLGLNLPDTCQRLTDLLWQRSGLSGPAVVLGLGSIPYLATELADDAVLRSVHDLITTAADQHQTSLRVVDYFAGISDVSFLGQGDVSAFASLDADTPGWDTLVALNQDSLLQVPTVNLGPWGRDYHRSYERLETDYAFRVLPQLLLTLSRAILASKADQVLPKGSGKKFPEP